ncbi:MAG: hypothetical protein IPJ69_05955 [Deltaproteobacteria bacterium]|nr:MAG: hypothetical protein IPJ69_05955 [Deltaproteobacteria bacterium]
MIQGSYAQACYQLGSDFAQNSMGIPLATHRVAFDFDGVFGLFGIKDEPKNRKFYEDARNSCLKNGIVRQHLMFYPGKREFVTGLNRYGRGPILVSTMPPERGLAIFRHSPLMPMAFCDRFSNGEVAAADLKESRRVFFAPDLGRGMRRLIDIAEGKVCLSHYPRSWRTAIEGGIEAVYATEGKHFLKLPIVVALAKEGVDLYDVIIEDTKFVIDPILDYSAASVIQPATPWGHQSPFHEDPVGTLRLHCSQHVEMIEGVLKGVMEDSRQGHYIYVPRDNVQYAPIVSGADIFPYDETAKSLIEGYYDPLKKLQERLAA